MPDTGALTRSRRPLFALLAAEIVSLLGNRLTVLAIPWFVLQTTGSAAQTGLVAAFSLLPFVLSSALGGALVDRIGYRRTSVLSDLASGLSVLGVPVLHHTVGVPLPALLALVFTGALLDAPGHTARAALFPDLVERAGMPMERATSLYDGVSRSAGMLGAPLAGVLIAAFGAANVLLVDAATFAVSAAIVAVFVTAGPRAPDADGPARYLAQLREGFAWLWGDRLTRAIVLMVVVTNMLDAALGGVLLPVYADRVLGSVVALGLLGGAWGLGAVLGTVAFATVGHRLPAVPILVAGFTLGGGSRWFLFAAEPGLPTLLVVSVIAGAAIGPVNPIFSTLLYRRIPERLRARVLGASSAGVMAAAPLGALLGGLCVGWVGLRATLVAFGAVYVLFTLSPLVVPAWRGAGRG